MKISLKFGVKQNGMENNLRRKGFFRRTISVRFIVDVTLWMAVGLPVLYLFLYGRPRIQGFLCDDQNLSYPYKPDTITTSVLVIIGFATSVAVIVVVEILNSLDTKCRSTCRYPGGYMYCLRAYCVFLVGFVIEELFVDAIKNRMGVLRPNFFDVCKPLFNRTLCPGYVTEYTCSEGDVRKILRSRQSFPSGHSTFSMYIAVYFCIYIQRTLMVKYSRVLKVFVQTGLIFIAALCGLDRIADNKHHLTDVVAGWLLGSSVAIFVWRVLGEEKVVQITSRDQSSLEKDVEQVEDTGVICCSQGQALDIEPNTPEPLLSAKVFQASHHGVTLGVCDETSGQSSK